MTLYLSVVPRAQATHEWARREVMLRALENRHRHSLAQAAERQRARKIRERESHLSHAQVRALLAETRADLAKEQENAR